MPPPPLKKAKTTSVGAAEPQASLGSIINLESLIESNSDSDSKSEDSGESDGSSSDSNDSDIVVIQNAPPSPPPTVSK
jgi:hypothetical protein